MLPTIVAAWFDDISKRYALCGRHRRAQGRGGHIDRRRVERLSSAFVSVVGGDFPQSYLDMMNERGINTEGIEVVKEGKTFFWSGGIQKNVSKI